MFRVNGREVFQLVAATGFGSDDDAVRRFRADLLNKWGGDFEREIVFRFQGAEGLRRLGADLAWGSGICSLLECFAWTWRLKLHWPVANRFQIR